jgi:hypothetical protein
VDTTGAGDAFIGSFATFLAGGATESEAIAKANVYAALSTLAVGTQMSFVTREHFETAWAGQRPLRYTSVMEKFDRFFEQFKVHASELGDKVRELIHEGNVCRIIIKDEQGHTFMEIPLTVATVGVVLAPVLAAVGAIATLVAHFNVVVERSSPSTRASAASGHGAGATDSSVGATENKTDMRGIVPQHLDNKGTKVEDIAGTGEHDSQGG